MFQNMYYGSFLSFSWAPESDFSVWSSIQMYYRRHFTASYKVGI